MRQRFDKKIAYRKGIQLPVFLHLRISFALTISLIAFCTDMRVVFTAKMPIMTMWGTLGHQRTLHVTKVQITFGGNVGKMTEKDAG